MKQQPYAEPTSLHVRIESGLKKDAEKVFKNLGITTTDAIRFFLIDTVDEQKLPCRSRIPNATTIAALEEDTTHAKRYKTVSELLDAIEAEDDAADD